MALSNVVKTQYDAGVLKITDGTSGTALVHTLRFDQANFGASGLKPGDNNRATKVYQSRGVVRSIRKGERTFPSGSVSLMLTEFSETGTGTILDMLAGTSGTPYATRVSTTATIGDVFTADLSFTMEGTTYGDAADHEIILEDCDFTVDIAEGDPNALTINYTCYGAVSGDISIPATA